MASARLNPYRDPLPFNRVRLGGRLIRATLKKINGATVKDNWKKQKSKESSGAVFSYQGTDPCGGESGFKLTFAAPREDQFDDLREMLDMIKPAPGQGGGTAATPATGQTFAIGSASKDGGSSGSSGSSSSSSSGATATGSSSSSSSSDKSDKDGENHGPRPPTLPIENALLNDWMGVFAVARAEYDVPEWSPTSGGWEWTVGFVHESPPRPAGTGAIAPAKSVGSQFALGSASPGDGAKAKANAGAAGT